MNDAGQTAFALIAQLLEGGTLGSWLAAPPKPPEAPQRANRNHSALDHHDEWELEEEMTV